MKGKSELSKLPEPEEPAEVGAGRKRKRNRSKKKDTPSKEKYTRGEKNNTKGIRSAALKKSLNDAEKFAKHSIEEAAKAEILLTEEAGYIEAEGMEDTWRFSQNSLRQHVDARTAKKMFDLQMNQFGPYTMDFTRNGRHCLLGGRKGHVASFEWEKFNLTNELHLRETVRDIKFLHDETMFAAAQKKYVYIYDNTGIELHCLRNQLDVNCLEFLPYHFLLACAGKSGFLKYTDTSTGQNVVELKPRLGEVKVMRQNPRNAILHLGHNNGTVTLWSPNVTTPLVKMLCHKAPVLACDVSIDGNHMVTSGLDGQVKVWDIRMYKEVHSYFTVKPASTISISDMGLLGLGYGSHVTVWKDAIKTKAQSPYLREEFPGKSIKKIRFVPFEDMLAVSHSDGFANLVIPGAGEPNFDTFEANPFQTLKQRREKTVVSLLEKLQPDMITLDDGIFGLMDKNSKTLLDSNRKAVREEKAKETLEDQNKARGRSRSSKRFRRSRKNIVDSAFATRAIQIQKKAHLQIQDKKDAVRKAKGLPKAALDRFTQYKVPE